jgi:beta-galactosidase
MPVPPDLAGAAKWIFKDFASPLRGHNGIPHINQKGVIARDLTKKESYYVFQSYWAEEPMLHIYGHTWPIRSWVFAHRLRAADR